ncbi:hypothetical protein LTR37_003889 [Vermiconidia calcicola]|uniref:Uncharacterized protein n=1 Tax=Vermiconidia calcicola TaxID=1690605 RepID=A0ACC3NPB0_9PEZI|nr:hypothetical protein LTR37_003889 [Vermiconidia calcicola]
MFTSENTRLEASGTGILYGQILLLSGSPHEANFNPQSINNVGNRFLAFARQNFSGPRRILRPSLIPTSSVTPSAQTSFLLLTAQIDPGGEETPCLRIVLTSSVTALLTTTSKPQSGEEKPRESHRAVLERESAYVPRPGNGVAQANVLCQLQTKMAENMLVFSFATLLENDGYTVSSICPGYCGTNLNGYASIGDPCDRAEVIIHLRDSV